MNDGIKMTFRIVAPMIIIGATYWFALPPINIHSIDMWVFILWSLVVAAVAINPLYIFRKMVDKSSGISFRNNGRSDHVPQTASELAMRIIGWVAVTVIATMLVGGVAGMEIFNATAYHDMLTLETGEFTQDVAELKMSQIPIVDRSTAERLGSRKLGEMSDLVSQFDIELDYTQINYRGVPYRVTPLAYADFFKWINNNADGLPGYITVDMTTQETMLVRFENSNKMKYSNSDLFLRDISRHLRFNYPSAIFDDVSFEIDDDGTPYWVASVLTYKIGLFGGKDEKGAVLCNAITGECMYYDVEDVPDWVDQVYSSNLVLSQLAWRGQYGSGFWNSVIGQRDVIQPTSGYNYVALDDDVWLYTGMTSVLTDESNVGFVLVNLRTKEGRYYAVPGAEEYSAMASAEGQVQNLAYKSTFPLLLNVADRPTYFVALKDGAGLCKMYAFIDMEHYQIVATGYSVDEAKDNYVKKLSSETSIEQPMKEIKEIVGVIENISTAVVDGNTRYYIILENNKSCVYNVDISVNDLLPFIQAGMRIEIKVPRDDTSIISLVLITQ